MEKPGTEDFDKIKKEESALQDHIFQLAFDFDVEPPAGDDHFAASSDQMDPIIFQIYKTARHI